MFWLLSSGNPENAGLEPALAVIPDSTFDYNTALVYQQSTPDAVIDNGVASSFSFSPADNIGGTEDQFVPKAGATVFFTSTGGDSVNGLIGMQYGTGRSISFSTLIGANELNNSDYATLFGNSVNWVAGTSVPEPASALMYAGLIGMTALAMGRKRGARYSAR